MRLNKFIAHTTGLSRREADSLIESGRIRVNNAAVQLGAQVNHSDVVLYDGKVLAHEAHYQYQLLNKPPQYVCSRKIQGETPTIYSLLPANLRHLKPVGRLDKDSSGLILLTDDGDFAHRMTHPKFAKTKIYDVTLDHTLEPLHMQIISDYGVALDDGVSQFQVSRVEPDRRGKSYTAIPNKHSPSNASVRSHSSPTYEVRMSEGRNRQIRRTFAALGYTVTRLHRISFGPYRLTDEKPGEFHPVSIS